MKLKVLYIILINCVGILFSNLHAQVVILSAGGTAYDTTGTISYSIGQILYTTYLNAELSVGQGIEQPYEISLIDDLNKSHEIILNYVTYPNPTIDVLHLRIDDLTTEKFIYTIFDLSGKSLLTHKISSTETIIPTNNFKPSTYILIISDGNKNIKTFKVVKN